MRVLPDPNLTPEELQQIQDLRDNHKIKSVRRRAQVILLAHKRFQGKEIARILDMDTSSITLILKRWGQDRIRCVLGKPVPGAKPKLLPEHIEALRKWVKESPRIYGYPSNAWTVKLLTDLLHQKYHLSISGEWIRKKLHQLNLSYKQIQFQPPTAPLEVKKKPKKTS